VNELGRGGRAVAACLAALWTGAGLAAVVLGLILHPHILPVALGLLAIAYGWVWFRVARTGRRVRWGRAQH
jgi:hypothetical protein